MDGSLILIYILPRSVIHAACAPIGQEGKFYSRITNHSCGHGDAAIFQIKFDKVDFGGCSAWMQCWIWMQRHNWHCVELIITRSIIVRAAFNLLHKNSGNAFLQLPIPLEYERLCYPVFHSHQVPHLFCPASHPQHSNVGNPTNVWRQLPRENRELQNGNHADIFW